jgi:hypothetical protein
VGEKSFGPPSSPEPPDPPELPPIVEPLLVEPVPAPDPLLE